MARSEAAPMSGVRVLEVASHVFVPAAGAILADAGAEVLKVEHPVTGDAYRGLVTLGLHHRYRGLDLNFQAANRGKRSVGVDLKTTAGRDLLHRFAARSDVFLTSFRSSAREHLGIDLDDIRGCNESIIYARGSGQGPDGPHAERAGYDIAAYWARSGIADRLAGVERPPFPPAAFGDLAGGMALAAAISAALYRRAVTGEPSVIDVSLLAVGMWQLQPDIVHATISDEPGDRRPVRRRGQTWNPLVEHYRTRDGRFIALVMVDGDRYWAELCQVLEAPDLATDPRFVDLAARREHGAACVAELDLIFARRDLDEWCRILDGFSGAWAPVQRPGELARDPQVAANGYLAAADIGDGHTMPMVTSPFTFDGAPAVPRRAPEHGEHTELALLELGLTWDEIGDLKDRRVIL